MGHAELTANVWLVLDASNEVELVDGDPGPLVKVLALHPLPRASLDRLAGLGDDVNAAVEAGGAVKQSEYCQAVSDGAASRYPAEDMDSSESTAAQTITFPRSTPSTLAGSLVALVIGS